MMDGRANQTSIRNQVLHYTLDFPSTSTLFLIFFDFYLIFVTFYAPIKKEIEGHFFSPLHSLLLVRQTR